MTTPLTDQQVAEIRELKLTTCFNAYAGIFFTVAEGELYREAVKHYNARLLAINEVDRLRQEDAADVVVWSAQFAGIPLGLYRTPEGARAHCADHYRQQLGATPPLAWYEEEPDEYTALRLYASHEGTEVETLYRAVPLPAHAEYDPERGE
jgi:hypothetical protein